MNAPVKAEQRQGSVAAVAIGRNEGQRLVTCLESLCDTVDRVVYVDSGSSDQSVAVAKKLGAKVVELDMTVPFTAARARNAGFKRVVQLYPETEFIQFLDGDCELDADWIETARSVITDAPDIAVVCGWRQERHPEATLWNAIVDEEWRGGPVGFVAACGGDALTRVTALSDVDGFNDTLIAGEEPEMCLRLRRIGWKIKRIDAPMTLHDADLTRFSQWWQRARRTGHTYAQGVAMYGWDNERYKRTELRRTLIWGALLPLFILAALFVFGAWALLFFLIYPLQILRLSRGRRPLRHAAFLVLGKFPELQGALGFWLLQRKTLIEYK